MLPAQATRWSKKARAANESRHKTGSKVEKIEEEAAMLSKWEAIFPTPVLRANIGREFTKEENEYFIRAQQHAVGNVLNFRSSNTAVLQEPALRSIRLFIEEHIGQFARKTITLNERAEFYVTQSWLNYTKRGQAHHRHFHTNSLVSGVFYVSAIREVDRICFYRNPAAFINVGEKDQNWYSADSWWFSVGAGDLVLFPSSVSHGVDSNEAGHTRVSLAFNTFVRGELGSKDLLNHLRL